MQRAPKPLRAITEAELGRLVGEMPDRYKALIEVMAYQGLRPGEAVSLRVGDFDPLRRELAVERAISGFTKTGIARTLTLPPSVAELLVAHIASFSDPASRDAPMFTTESGGAIASKFSYDAWVRRHFAPAVERAGITTKISPNDLRHYAVKFAIGHGADVFAVQKMLGHAKPSITLEVYGSEWESHAERLAEQMDEPIRRARRATPPAEAKVVRL
jgi:integrase